MSSTDRLSAALIATARQSSNTTNLGSERASFFPQTFDNSLKPRGSGKLFLPTSKSTWMAFGSLLSRMAAKLVDSASRKRLHFAEKSHPARKRANTLRWKNEPRCEIARQSQAPTPAQGRAWKKPGRFGRSRISPDSFQCDRGRIDNPKTDLLDKLIGAKLVRTWAACS